MLAIFSSILLTALMPVPAQTQDASTLTIRITGARNTNGQIDVTLFQDAQGFPDGTSKAIRQQTVQIDPSTMGAQVTFKDLPQGTFAVSVLHDENKREHGQELFGDTKGRPWGFEQPKKQRRARSFDEAKFSLNAAAERPSRSS